MSRDPLELPDRWLHCPKIGKDVAGIFIPFKTPLDEAFGKNIPNDRLRWEPKDVLGLSKVRKLELGAVVDLTNSSRYYQPKYFHENDIVTRKIACRGFGEAPDSDATQEFVVFCSNFRANHPHKKIGVHCTHGFNRTGFLICAYLILQENWDVAAAINCFTTARKPGIYKQGYIDELLKRFGDQDGDQEPIEAPARPTWDGSGESSVSSASKAFMEGIPGVRFVDDDIETEKVQKLAAHLCDYKRNGFPGSQPVSLGRDNLNRLAEMPYRVSWKADGTRYLMLIAGADEIYFLDRDNAVFRVSGLTFPYRKDKDQHLDRTLLDGEMVLDHHCGHDIPRYLVYDIVHFRDHAIGKMNFDIRMLCIQKEIIDARREASYKGLIRLADEPFALRKKDFFDVEVTGKILAEKFQKEVSHEIDGVIFQPIHKPYVPGRYDLILKWKPPHLNSIDFLLKIEKFDGGEGCVPKTRGGLYVGGYGEPMAFLKRVTPEARALNGKIVECKFKDGGWVIMRERTDKSFPNGYKTAMGVWDSITHPITESSLLEFIRDKAFKDVKPQLMPPPPPPPPPAPHHATQTTKRQAEHDSAMPPPAAVRKPRR